MTRKFLVVLAVSQVIAVTLATFALGYAGWKAGEWLAKPKTCVTLTERSASTVTTRTTCE